MVEPQDGFHQGFFATGTTHGRGFAAWLPDQDNGLSLQLKYDLRDALGLLAAGEDAVMPDAHKTPGQDVLRKAADELHRRQLHYLVAAVAVVLVTEAHTVFVNGQEPMVADGDLVRVSAQVIDHRTRRGKGPLGIDHPGLCKERAEELRIFSWEGFAQCRHHPTAHHPAQRPYREEVLSFGACTLPEPGCGDAPAGYDAVQVRMQGEVLTPGVQHGDHTRVRSQVGGIAGKGTDHTPGCGKERIIDTIRPIQAQTVQLPGQGEHHMEVRHRQELGLAGCHPVFPGQDLALGTVAVPATVVAYAQVGTGGALIQMPAQGRRAAVPDQAQGALLPVVELRALLNLCPCLPYDLRYFAGRPQGAGAKSVSSGLNGALRPCLATCRYTIVVSMRSWPSSSLMETMSSPSSSKWVA